MKTDERLAEPGGNVHYERFHTEVLGVLQKHEPVTYCPYQCNTGTLGEPIQVEHKNLTIVEGSYCLHPTLQQAYDLKIFLTLDSQVQKQRILKRNGEEKLLKFISQWIPLENHYFTALDIKTQCDFIVDTTFL
jgi:uridine kinase